MRRLLQEAVRITATPAADGTPAPAMAAILRANASVAPGTTLGPLGVTLASTMPPLGPLDPPWPGSNNTNLTLAAVDDEFAEDLGYSDMQIVFLACVLTAGPLLAVLLSIVGVRFVWRKFQGDDLDDELDEMLRRAETRQSLSQEQLKTSESQFTVLASDDAESGRGGGGGGGGYANHADGIGVSVVSGPGGAASDGLGDCGRAAGGGSAGGAAAGHAAPPPHRHTQHNTMSSRSSNGSVITLTMHNNHLIVEKEEIVESSQEEALYALAFADQQAIVHPPPAAAAAAAALVKGADTGLSQPDLSGGSEGENPAYAYGNQVGYDSGPMGYTSYNGYRVEGPPSRLRQASHPLGAATPPRPVLPGPQDSVDVVDVQDLPEDSPQPQRLMSDIQARKDALQRQEDHVQEPPAENGGLVLSADLDIPAADDGDDDSTSATEDVCSVKAQSPTPPQTLSLGQMGPAEQTLRSPTVEKLRLQEAASPDVERLSSASTRTSSTPPRSPLAQRDRDQQ